MGRLNVLLLLLLSILSNVAHAILFDAVPCERASAVANDLSKICFRDPIDTLSWRMTVLLLLLRFNAEGR